ncbi:MAG: hypothetical protein M0T74_13780 [Desulfitobacterium hafniense]|nr:hypothetical protein [Desulfitobacterium hafniense]
MPEVKDTESLSVINRGKVLVEVKYRDLADLIFILQDQANIYHDLDECCDELTVYQFTEWLLTMKGSVELVQYIPRPKGDA